MFIFTSCNSCTLYLVLAHLFVKVPRPGDSKVTFSVFESSCHPLFQFNHSKAEAIPLRALPKDTTSELASLSSHYSFNAERQVGKLLIPTFLNLLVRLDEGIEPRSTVFEDTLTARLRAGLNTNRI